MNKKEEKKYGSIQEMTVKIKHSKDIYEMKRGMCRRNHTNGKSK